MTTFTDNAGRSWTVRVDVAVIKRVRDTLATNIVDLSPAGGFAKLSDDVVLLVDVLYVLVRDQAAAANVTDEEFGRGLAGDALDQASKALLAELAAFFPNRLQREALLRLQAAGETLQTRELATLIDKINAATSSASATSSPESSVSTPDRSP